MVQLNITAPGDDDVGFSYSYAGIISKSRNGRKMRLFVIDCMQNNNGPAENCFQVGLKFINNINRPNKRILFVESIFGYKLARIDFRSWHTVQVAARNPQ